jgi:hypothetical protein
MNEIGCLLLMICVVFLLAFSFLMMWFVAGDNPWIWLIFLSLIGTAAYVALSKSLRDLRRGDLTADELWDDEDECFEDDEDD